MTNPAHTSLGHESSTTLVVDDNVQELRQEAGRGDDRGSLEEGNAEDIDNNDRGLSADSDDGDDQGGHGKKQKGRRKPTKPFWVAARYISLSLLALGLTLFCPGNDREGKEKALLQCLVLYGLTITLFFFLRGSDPGYLTTDNMKDFSPDTITLLEYEQEHKNEDQDQPEQGEEDPPSAPLGARRRNKSAEGDVLILPQTHQQQQQQEQQQHPEQLPACSETVASSSFSGTARRRYCPTCQLAPPLRSHHCKLCNQCVATWDHHCDFVGACIGERNHCLFWWFLLVQALGFALFCHNVNASSLGLQTLLTKGGSEAFPYTALYVVASKVYLYPLTFFAWVMLLFHTWTALTNSTTFECTKGAEHLEYLQGTKPCDFPFSKVSNLLKLCHV